MIDLTAKVKAAREAKRMSQAEVARRLEMDTATYHRLEKRGEKMGIDQAMRIAEVLEMNLVELLTYGEAEKLTGERSEADAEAAKEIKRLIDELESARSLLSAYTKATEYLIEEVRDAVQSGPPETAGKRVEETLRRGHYYLDWGADHQAALRWLANYNAQAIVALFEALAKTALTSLPKAIMSAMQKANEEKRRYQEKFKPLEMTFSDPSQSPAEKSTSADFTGAAPPAP